ncbi:emp24/gp25L/p24 family protein [Klebsormidium nitens]|uniref:Emp24/gp25L/p24 family protein n=1 Tax=Klebsormidium nitens TaxID=105231 RepID=A0A1Y1IT80_KLENI|nr:emp24/gp25L/p24 family protein [Klebsormidium nitens]|eukprot:GAQ92759.1 emp24/gp25L/p24 family protein [Klebsormidium nitens]
MAPWKVIPVLISLLVACEAIKFEIQGGSSKCLGEEIGKGTLVVGEYKVVEASAPAVEKISVKVTSPFGKLLHSGDIVPSGQFGFTTEEAGNVMACFWIPGSTAGQFVTVELNWKIGVNAKDWEGVAKKDKITDIELDLRRLEAQVTSVLEEMTYMREREMQMRNLNEITNSRVAWFGILSLVVCLGVAGWQATYLKGYFERKKIL